MIQRRQSEPQLGSSAHAFTLIEIVVALTIIAIVLTIAIPTLKGLDQDEKLRAPITQLAEMVQDARDHAMREGRAYQIVFEREGIHASPSMFPFEKRDEFLKFLEEMRTPPRPEEIERLKAERANVQRQEVVNARAQEELPGEIRADEPPLFKMPWTVTLPIPEGTECEVLMWGDGEWDVIEGDKMRRWTFQPTGMANPARVRFRSGETELESGFDLLTGELVRERTGLGTKKQ
jgi:prepilin-type N-terminal cleavage/methylation domain-containing protein